MNNESLPVKLILASSSKYRAKLLQRLGLPFDCESPEIDETALENETPRAMVARLATRKAESVSGEHPQAVVIGSDQLAVFDRQIIGKPGSHQLAAEQLAAFSGHVVEFLTAVTVHCIDSGFVEQHTDCTRVSFRSLQSREIERYLEKEKPFDCAGAFKAESLGIALFDHISSGDPTALVGLPLIATAGMLRRAGFELP